MNQEDIDQIFEFIVEWINSPDIYPEEKRAFFAAYDKAGKKLDDECIDIINQSFERQKKQLEAQDAEAEENKRLLKNVIARQEVCAPGSFSRQILDQADRDMDKMVDEFADKLTELEREANTKNQKSDNK